MNLSREMNRADRFADRLSLLAQISPHFKWQLGQTAIYSWNGYREPVVISGFIVVLENDCISLQYQITTLKSLTQLENGETDYPDILEVKESELIADKYPTSTQEIPLQSHLNYPEVA